MKLSLIKVSLIADMVIGALFFTSPAQGAAPPKFGLLKPVKVVCVKFNNVPTPRKATCQEWVDQFNQEVSPWYAAVSDNRVSYEFALAPLQANAQRPPGDWISLPHPGSVGFFVDTLKSWVMPTIDPIIDFSSIDHLVIVSAGESGFGQAPDSTNPDDSVLSSWPLPVNEGGEFQMEDPPGVFKLHRRIAVALLGEGIATDTNFIQRSSSVLIHEFGHLHGFPDRYETFNMNGSGRDYVTGYSPMGIQWDGGINALSVHYLAFEQHWTGFGHLAAPILEIPKNTIAEEHDIVTLATANAPSRTESMLKVPVEGSGSTFSTFRGYSVEARKRDISSKFNDHVLQEGVVVTWIDPTVKNDLKVVDDPGNPADLWNAAFEVGDHFEDGGRGVIIDVVQSLANGFRVRVTNTNPMMMLPDPRITPWTTDSWESVDIWIDSPVNGYGVFTSADGNRDVPGVRSNPMEPAIVNQVHYRVSNDGLSTAQNLVAKVSYAIPGIDPPNWILVGSKPIGAIPPGQNVTGFADWVVPDGFANGEPHACVKVEIVSDPSADLNLNNNLAQENIFQFETVSSSPWQPRGRIFTVTNTSRHNARVLLHLSGLPAGWAVRLRPSGFALGPGQRQAVDFRLYPAGAPRSRPLDYAAGYLAKVKVQAQFNLRIKDRHRVETRGGVNAWVRLTEETKTSLSIKPGSRGAFLQTCVRQLTGRGVAGARVSVQYWKGKTARWTNGITAANGCTTNNIEGLALGRWAAKSFYAGTGKYSSSRSATQTFVSTARVQ